MDERPASTSRAVRTAHDRKVPDVVTVETLEPPSVTQGYDTSTRATIEAIHHLIAYRDNLFAHLMWLAEATSELAANEQAAVFERLFIILGADEAKRRAAQISVLATPCWGIFREIGAQRIASVDLLRRVLLDTATAVRDAMHRDSCVCGVAR